MIFLRAVEKWPQLGFLTLFYALLVGSIIEIVTQIAIAIRNRREDKKEASALAK